MDLTLELLRPNTMMNERLVEVCRHLTDDQVAATVDGTYGGIGATLVHIANGRIGYVPRLVLDEKPDHLSEDPFPGSRSWPKGWAGAMRCWRKRRLERVSFRRYR